MLCRIRIFFENTIVKHIAIFLSALVCFYIASSFASNNPVDKTVEEKVEVKAEVEEKAKAELAYYFSKINDLDETVSGDNGFIGFNNVYCKTESNSSHSSVYLSGSIIVSEIYRDRSDNYIDKSNNIELPFSAIIEVKEPNYKVIEATVRGKILNG